VKQGKASAGVCLVNSHNHGNHSPTLLITINVIIEFKSSHTHTLQSYYAEKTFTTVFTRDTDNCIKLLKSQNSSHKSLERY